MSLGDRRDSGNARPQDRLNRPHKEWPSPNVEDLVVIEDVQVTGDFTPLYPGTPRDEFSNLQLVSEKELEGTEAQQWVRRTWATERLAQEAYNLALKYTESSVTAPVYIRRYQQITYTAATFGTPLTAVTDLAITAGGSGYSVATLAITGTGTGATGKVQIRGGAIVGILLTAGGTGYTATPTVTITGDGTGATASGTIQPQTALLIDQSATPSEGAMGNLFFDVMRVWMTLPGPVLTSYIVDGETQTPVQVDTQLIANPGAAPAQLAGTAATCTVTFSAAAAANHDYVTLTSNSGSTTTLEFFASPVTAVASTGGALTLTTPTDGHTVTLTTNAGVAYVFEFDPTNNGVTGGRTQIPGSTDAAATTALKNAVNATGVFTAASVTSTSLSLARVATGASNQTITFSGGTITAKTDFSGGVDGTAHTIAGSTFIEPGASFTASATNYTTAINATTDFTAIRASGVVTVTRVAAGGGNTTVTKVGTNIAKTDFAGGDLTSAASVEYKAISAVHGQKTTASLLNFASITKYHYSDIDYSYPRIISGITFYDMDPDGGQVKIAAYVQATPARRKPRKATTTVTYNTTGNLAWVDCYAPDLIDMIYNGYFLNLRETGVYLENTVTNTFNTASTNPLYGYLYEYTPTWQGQGVFPYGQTKTIGCKISPWKYNLERRETTTIVL